MSILFVVNGLERQAELQFLIECLKDKLKEVEDARIRDAMFDERKRLNTELKDLNSRLQLCLSNTD